MSITGDSFYGHQRSSSRLPAVASVHRDSHGNNYGLMRHVDFGLRAGRRLGIHRPLIIGFGIHHHHHRVLCCAVLLFPARPPLPESGRYKPAPAVPRDQSHESHGNSKRRRRKKDMNPNACCHPLPIPNIRRRVARVSDDGNDGEILNGKEEGRTMFATIFERRMWCGRVGTEKRTGWLYS